MKRKKTRRVFTNEERQIFVNEYDGLTPDEHTPWLEANGFHRPTIRRFRQLIEASKAKKPPAVEILRLAARGLPPEAGVRPEAPLDTLEVLLAYMDVKRNEYRMLGKFINELEGLVQSEEGE